MKVRTQRKGFIYTWNRFSYEHKEIKAQESIGTSVGQTKYMETLSRMCRLRAWKLNFDI